MIKDAFKICGLRKEEILKRLTELDGCGVSFDVQEDCLDAKIEMSGEMGLDGFESVKSLAYNLFEEEVYSAGDRSLQELVGQLLKLNKKILGVAESLTGGEICSRLAEIPGISENFYEGVVCYNIESKIRRINVPKTVLSEYGAVSRETAYAMVKGITRDPVTIGLATTGLAGPSADEGKPVGLVFIGVGGGDFITVFEKHFTGTRQQIRNAAANCALFYLVRYLKNDILRL